MRLPRSVFSRAQTLSTKTAARTRSIAIAPVTQALHNRVTCQPGIRGMAMSIAFFGCGKVPCGAEAIDSDGRRSHVTCGRQQPVQLANALVAYRELALLHFHHRIDVV